MLPGLYSIECLICWLFWCFGAFFLQDMNKVEGGEINSMFCCHLLKSSPLNLSGFSLCVPALIGTGTSVFGKVKSDLNVCSMITKQNYVFILLE